MALFKSSNPTMTEKIFDKSLQQYDTSEGTMTVNGSMGKFGFLLLMVMGGAFYTWNLYARGEFSLMQTLMYVGIFGGLISVIAITIKPKLAKYISPLYGILEGFFLGAISAMVNNALAEKAPGIIPQAVGLTFAVGIVMFALYRFGIIKVTDKLRSIIFSATLGIALFYLATWVLGMFHVNVGFMYNSSLLGIGISVFVVIIAAMNLLLDFDMIERGSQAGAPKYMEWYGAFGLLVTIVWLYLEILRLLMRVYGRK